MSKTAFLASVSALALTTTAWADQWFDAAIKDYTAFPPTELSAGSWSADAAEVAELKGDTGAKYLNLTNNTKAIEFTPSDATTLNTVSMTTTLKFTAFDATELTTPENAKAGLTMAYDGDTLKWYGYNANANAKTGAWVVLEGVDPVEDTAFTVKVTVKNFGIQYEVNGTALTLEGTETSWIDTNETTLTVASIQGIGEVSALSGDQIATTYLFYIGDKGYESFADLLAAVKDGDTVKLGADTTLPAGATLDKAITFDLNGFKLTVAEGETATFAKNVTISNSKSTGGLDVNGTIAVAGGVLDASGLAIGSGGLTTGLTGGLNIAAGATFKMMAAWAGSTPNWMAANRAGFLTGATGAIVQMGEKVYTYGGDVWAAEGQVAKVEITSKNDKGEDMDYVETFDSLTAAITAANGNSPLTLLADQAADGLVVNKALTVELDGKMLTVNAGATLTAGADLTIVNGGATGGLTIAGTVVANAKIDLDALAYGEGGLLKQQGGALTIGATGSVKFMAAWDGETANALNAYTPGFFLNTAEGAKVITGKTYTWNGNMFVVDNQIATASVTKMSVLTFDDSFDAVADALANANATKPVTLVENMTTPEAITVPAGITLDLNNKVFNPSSVVNNGTIKVYDIGTAEGLSDIPGTLLAGATISKTVSEVKVMEYPQGTTVNLKVDEFKFGEHTNLRPTVTVNVPAEQTLTWLLGVGSYKQMFVTGNVVYAGDLSYGWNDDLTTKLEVTGNMTLMNDVAITNFSAMAVSGTITTNGKKISLNAENAKFTNNGDLEANKDVVSGLTGFEVQKSAEGVYTLAAKSSEPVNPGDSHTSTAETPEAAAAEVEIGVDANTKTELANNGISEDTYKGYFTKTVTGESGNYTVTVELSAATTNEVQAKIDQDVKTIDMASSDTEVSVTLPADDVKPGLYYGIAVSTDINAVKNATPDEWKMATASGVSLTADKPAESTKGFYMLKCAASATKND